MSLTLYKVELPITFTEEFFSIGDTGNELESLQIYLNSEKNFFKKIDESTLYSIQNKKSTLLLKVTNEGDINKNGIELLEAILEHYKIPIDYFILIHDCYRLPNTNIKNYQLNTHMLCKSNESIGLNKQNKLNTSLFNNKKYKFHYPIRRFRYHRILLLDKLYLKYPDFIDSNLISYDINLELNKDILLIDSKSIEDNKFNVIDTYSNLFFSNISKNLKEYMVSTVSKHIDAEDSSKWGGYHCEFKHVYEKSYFTIVSETYFFEDYYYISEKTFKPIAHMHPFIVMGRPGILEYLKKNGFKTFHPFIDESYDLENDNDKRFEMVFKEIIRLNELPYIELDEMMNSISDILKHNQKNLLKMGGISKMNANLAEYLRKTIKNTKKII